MKFKLLENVNFNSEYAVKINLKLESFDVNVSADNSHAYDTRYNSIISNDDVDDDLSKSIRNLIEDIIVTIGINRKEISDKLNLGDFDFNYDNYFDIFDEENLYIDFLFSCNKEINYSKLEKVLNTILDNNIEFSSNSEFKNDDESIDFYCEGKFKIDNVEVDVVEQYNESLNAKSSLNEALKKATAYMIRNDGRIFEVPKNESHYYAFLGMPKTVYSLSDLIAGFRIDDAEWFYKNTRHPKVKELFQNIVRTVYEDKKQNRSRTIYWNICLNGLDDLEYCINNGKILTEDELVAAFLLFKQETNQEFLRARISDMYYGGQSGDAYFRISSKGFNWFDIIWNIVYDNKNFIDSVTVIKDPETNYEFVTNGMNLSKDMYVDHMSTEEFINLSGNPVYENLKHTNKFMENVAKGQSITESTNTRNIIRSKNIFIESFKLNNLV